MKYACIYVSSIQSFQKQLDAKYDKHERLVKLSRDCTIQSKRIIFLLHRIPTSDLEETDKEMSSCSNQFNDLISEADQKLQNVAVILKKIAVELQNDDPERFHTAYTNGVQEFIEALSFYVFQKERRLISLEEAKKWLEMNVHETDGNITKEESGLDHEERETKLGLDQQEEKTEELVLLTIPFPLSDIDYLLGVADLTGELMRLSINAAGSGNWKLPYSILEFMRELYCCFLRLRPYISKIVSRKVTTLRESLFKIENVCYRIKVRGSEVPQHMLVDEENSKNSPSNIQEVTENFDAEN